MFSRSRAAALLALPVAVALTFTTDASAGKKPVPGYLVTNLVSNGAVSTPNFDPNMVNTWGVSFNPTGLVWVTNNRTGTSTLYDGNGVPNSLIVNVPPASGTGTGLPTGIIFSATSDFVVTNGTASGPSRFVFASEDGLISGWAPNVDLHNAQRAVVTPGANYKGLAVAVSNAGTRLYATDFHQGHVDIFDGSFHKVTIAGAFVDPNLPKDTFPFNIQALNNDLYVTFAKHGGGLTGGVTGGSGAVGNAQAKDKGGDSVIDVFDTDGKFLRRAVKSSTLKQPWGLAIAPADFGKYAGNLLVGDFHDGTISAYDATTGKLKGQLADTAGKALVIPGLWGFEFGNGVNSQPTNALFFAAGPNGQGGGVYGSVTAVTK